MTRSVVRIKQPTSALGGPILAHLQDSSLWKHKSVLSKQLFDLSRVLSADLVCLITQPLVLLRTLISPAKNYLEVIMSKVAFSDQQAGGCYRSFLRTDLLLPREGVGKAGWRRLMSHSPT